ncbi:MAG: hypothetical protein M1825_001396 [Sarcosagium campestre]|nr:MAG: hypothetical protein M1825_001396 [Sarcosagium campestre]
MPPHSAPALTSPNLFFVDYDGPQRSDNAGSSPVSSPKSARQPLETGRSEGSVKETFSKNARRFFSGGPLKQSASEESQSTKGKKVRSTAKTSLLVGWFEKVHAKAVASKIDDQRLDARRASAKQIQHSAPKGPDARPKFPTRERPTTRWKAAVESAARPSSELEVGSAAKSSADTSYYSGASKIPAASGSSIKGRSWERQSPSATIHSDSSSTKSLTKLLLNVASTLLFLPLRENDSPNAVARSRSSRHNLHEQPRSLRIKLPHRERSGLSATSSMLEVMMSNAPPPTPAEEALYSIDARKDYFIVEISNAGEPDFLPSEAKKVLTPKWTPRLKQPSDEETSVESTSSFDGPHNLVRLGLVAPQAEMDDETQELYTEGFDMAIPQHLPGSPLCPSSPNYLHRGQDRGMCFAHGQSR